jgi:DNA-binding Lrp family transcriptional regulator
VKLSDREQDILKYIELNSEATVSEIAKTLDLREHIVRYSLRRLVDNNLLVRRVFLNTYRLGYLRFSIFICLTPEGIEFKRQFIKALQKSEFVSLILELGGEFHLEINVTVRTLEELMSFLDWVSEKYGRLIFQKQMAIVTAHSVFGTTVLSKKTVPLPKLFYGPTEETVVLDESGHRVLSALMRSRGSSSAELARLAGLPASTVVYRIKKLEQQKVIQGYTYWLKNIDVQRYILLVNGRRTDRKVYQRLERFGGRNQFVTYLVSKAGSWDFELGLAVQNSSQIDSVIGALNRDFKELLSVVKICSLYSAHKGRDYPFETFCES